MTSGTKVRYVANQRLKVGDDWREPGEEVPEAASWMNVAAYVSTGKLSIITEEGATEQVEIRNQRGLERVGGTAPRHRLVPKRLVRVVGPDEDAEDEQAEDGSAGSTEEEPSSPSSSETPTGEPDETPTESEEEGDPNEEVVSYDDMTIDDVKRAYDEGLLDADTIDEFEGQRTKGRRTGIDDWLMSLEGDESESDEDEEEDEGEEE